MVFLTHSLLARVLRVCAGRLRSVWRPRRRRYLSGIKNALGGISESTAVVHVFKSRELAILSGLDISMWRCRSRARKKSAFNSSS